MTAPVEEWPDAGRGEQHRTAFGLALRIDPRISIQGLGQSADLVSTEPSSHIRLDPDELGRRWDALTTTPARVRELRFGETLLMSVDFADPAGYLLWTRNFGRMLISHDGLELLCEPDPINADWATIIAAQGLPLAATIRGLEVFHASGVVVDDRALLIAGPRGAGKSSLAAALVRAGGRLLSDDAVALQLSDGSLTAHAGSVMLQLRTAEDERLSVDDRAALGRRANSPTGKQRYLADGVPDSAPVGGLFLIERSSEEPVVEQLAAVDPFELIASTFNLSVRTPARLRHQLDVVSAIASAGLAHRLRVQPDIDATRLAAILQEHLAWVDVPGEPAPSGAQSGRGRLLEL
jgi:hypothetical protein